MALKIVQISKKRKRSERLKITVWVLKQRTAEKLALQIAALYHSIAFFRCYTSQRYRAEQHSNG